MRLRVAAALLAVAGALAGCGLGPGRTTGAVTVTVSDGFGARTVASVRPTRVRESETAMRLLQRHLRVTTRYGGGFVQSIDGLGGGHQDGRPVDWFYYVNGIEASRGAAATRLHAGDRVWWDRHDWGAAIHIPAVVGAFPQPFRSGSGGRRLPVTLACASGAGAACAAARDRLSAAGIPIARSLITTPTGKETLRVLVGPWPQLREDQAARRIERGPGVSGVFARLDPTGGRLAVLDPRGRTVRTLGANAGLVAATSAPQQRPTWIVTGTDRAGILAAARALDEGDLAGHFALGISDGRAVRLPELRP